MGVSLGVSVGSLNKAGDALEEVEVLNARRTYNLLQRHKLRDRSHLSAVNPHEDVVQRRRVESVFRRSTRHDAIHLTKLIEVAHVGTTTVGTQCPQHGSRRHTCTVALGGIHFYLVLWKTLRVGRHCHTDFRTLTQFGEEVVCQLRKFRQVAVLQVLQHQVDTVVRTIARHLRQLEWHHLHVLDFLAGKIQTSDDQVDVVVEALTLLPWLQTDNHRGIVRTRARHHTVAAGSGKAFHLRNLLHLFLHSFHYLTRLKKSRTLRSTDFSQDNALVLLRNEARRQVLHEEEEQQGSNTQQTPCQHRALDELLHTLGVLLVDGVIARRIGFLGIVGQILSLAFVLVELQHDGAEGRAERQRRHARKTDSRGNGHTKLREERTRRAWHECHRDKHRHEHERTRNHRHRHVAHRLAGGLLGIADAAFHLRHHRLDNHNGVIHHRTNCQHQCEQCQDVEGESSQRNDGESTQQ